MLVVSFCCLIKKVVSFYYFANILHIFHLYLFQLKFTGLLTIKIKIVLWSFYEFIMLNNFKSMEAYLILPYFYFIINGLATCNGRV